MDRHDKNMWKNKGPLEKKPQKEKAWILGRKKKSANAKPGSKTRICKTYEGRRRKMMQKIVKQ